jgi:hypothetical protein
VCLDGTANRLAPKTVSIIDNLVLFATMAHNWIRRLAPPRIDEAGLGRQLSIGVKVT